MRNEVNYSSRTRQSERSFLYGWFAGQAIRDRTHPQGHRQLLLWEAMRPVVGRQLIVAFSKGLVSSGLRPRTVNGYLGSLRRLFGYVLEYPPIPAADADLRRGVQPQAIVPKYGPLEQPVLEFDYPAHVLDEEAEGFVLTSDALMDFYDFIRLDHVPNHQKKLSASRDYAMVVLAAESGLRGRRDSQPRRQGHTSGRVLRAQPHPNAPWQRHSGLWKARSQDDIHTLRTGDSEGVSGRDPSLLLERLDEHGVVPLRERTADVVQHDVARIALDHRSRSLGWLRVTDQDGLAQSAQVFRHELHGAEPRSSLGLDGHARAYQPERCSSLRQTQPRVLRPSDRPRRRRATPHSYTNRGSARWP
jgi:hypothetical protein